MQMMRLWLLALGLAVIAAADGGALAGKRHRVLVSTDIGGTDPDDFQSMVHLLAYADVLDLEGLVASPYGLGRKGHILEVIDAYAKDYAKLKSYSERYPAPDALRAITKQGALDTADYRGYGKATEGSDWIIACARRADSRPLHVLVWGGIDDLAQALHDAPDILPKLRVYFIGGPNKKWSVDAYNYVEQQHPKLWMIEANATYRGWFTGGNQSGTWGNEAFVAAHVAGHGALGDLFVRAKDSLKMGDSPAVGWLLRGEPEDATQAGWGGRFVRIWDGRKTVFERLTTEADEVEAFGVTEFALAVPRGFTGRHRARMVFDGGVPASPGVIDGKILRFRFSPRDAKVWPYVIESDFAGLDGKGGKFRAVPPRAERTRKVSTVHPQWWIDDPDPAAAVGVHPGAKSVSQWREEFLGDFAERMRRCQGVLSVAPQKWGGGYLSLPREWYGTEEARRAADSVIRYQSAAGGWLKNTDLLARVPAGGVVGEPTIDNGATTMPMRFLALVADATGEAKYRESFLRGMDYLFAAQYPNGGWPQFFPLKKGYYSRITFNDDAMVNVLTLLRDAGAGDAPFGFVDSARRGRAAGAVARGIEVILRTQIRQGGKRTGWCAQHDEVTLAPAWARAYEPPSVSGGETVGIVRLLMSLPAPSAEVVAAVEGAVEWLRSVAMAGVRVDRVRLADGRMDRVLAKDAGAPLLWARFYELETNRPLYLDRDSVFRYEFAEIGYERRNGYSYHGTWAGALLEKEYPRWRAQRGSDVKKR